MQNDTHAKLAPLTIFFHWTIAIMVIAALCFGFYIHNLPPSPDKAPLIFIHKNVGVIIFLLAISRIAWRYRNGFFQPAAPHKPWEEKSARLVHILLLLGTILMPISGMMFTLGYGCPACTVPVFWLFEIGPLNERILWLGKAGQTIHEICAYCLAAALLIHAAAALKHHYLDGDGTLRRMLGRNISP